MAKELFDAIHPSRLPSGASAAPPTFPLAAAIYSYSASTSLHSIWALSVCFLFFVFFPRGFLQSLAWPLQSTEKTLDTWI